MLNSRANGAMKGEKLGTMDIDDVWKRIKLWLHRNVPAYYACLPPGASLSEIDETEKLLGREIPAGLKKSLSIHNGGLYFEDATFLLPLTGPCSIISCNTILQRNVGRSRKGDFVPFALQDLGEWELGEERYHEKCIYAIDGTLDKVTVWQYMAKVRKDGSEIIAKEVWAPRKVGFANFMEEVATELETGAFTQGPGNTLMRKTTLERETKEREEQEARENFVPPVTEIASPFPTKLIWEEDYDWWTGKYRENSRMVHIRISPDYSKNSDMQTFVENCFKLFSDIRCRQVEILKTASDHLLDDYNCEWRGRNPELSPDQFMSKLKLSSIQIHGEGGATIFYTCGKLFQGHDIEVRLESVDTVTEVCLAG